MQLASGLGLVLVIRRKQVSSALRQDLAEKNGALQAKACLSAARGAFFRCGKASRRLGGYIWGFRINAASLLDPADL